MKSLLFFEVVFVILGGIVAPLIAFGPFKENRPKAFGALVVLIGLTMFLWDQSLLTTSGRGLSEHFNCAVWPDGVSCRKKEDAAAAKNPTPEVAPIESAQKKLAASKALALGGTAYAADDFLKARILFREACDGGDVAGCFNLAFMWEKGLGGDTDEEIAFTLYNKACDEGRGIGCNNIRRRAP